jgi:hypothetical protein
MNRGILATSKLTVAAPVLPTVVGPFGQNLNQVEARRANDCRRSCNAALPNLLGVAMALVLAGCQASAPRRGVPRQELHPQADVAVNAEQARIRIRVLVQPFCGALAAAADQIITGTTNNATRRAALVWKIEAVPILRETLFHPNPYLALGDTWVFLMQMADYFQNGPGKRALDDSAPIATAACASLEKQLAEVAGSFTRSGDVTDVRAFLQKWAADHPIKHSIAGRESVVGYFTKRSLQQTFSAPEAAGDFIVTADDLNRRIDIYGGQLLDQSRWQAELFAIDLASQYQAENAMPLAGKAVQSVTVAAGAVERAIGPLERTAAALETLPGVIAKERVAAQQDIQEEVSRVLQFEQQELKATLAQLTNEVTNERVATLLELHRNIAEERIAFTRDLERLSFNVVDHAFLRTAQLAAGIVLLTFAGVVVLLFLARRLFLTRKTTA